MNEEKIKEFDEYVQKHYSEIKRSAYTICNSFKNDEVDDIIHETYLKLRKKIEKDGFSGTNFGGYLFISLKNTYGMSLRKQNRNKTVHIEDVHYHTNHSHVNYTQIVEKMLREQEAMVRSSQRYDAELMEISRELFEYVRIVFDEKEVYLFREYFLTTPKQTYRKLAARTNFSIQDISMIMKRVKKNIRLNFIDWYKEKYNDN